MNLYQCTMKGILAAREAHHRRLLQNMAAAVIRKAQRPGFGANMPSGRNLKPASQKVSDGTTRNPTDGHSLN